MTQPLAWRVAPGARIAACADAKWFADLTLFAVDGALQHRTPAGVEACLLVLGGTFDLAAGAGSWAQRGVRPTPFDGRPCALYLPPDTPLRAAGTGELLLVACRRPEPAPTPAAEQPRMLPLLPLAGSGKAWDARTGSWELIERFPSSPEAVLPRAISRVQVGAVPVERVFGPGFKAMALHLDETVLPAGSSLRVIPAGAPPADAEACLFLRAPAGATLRVGADARSVEGDAAFVIPVGADVEIHAGAGPVFAVCAWAWDKARAAR